MVAGFSRFLVARKYQAVGFGKLYLRIALHLMAHCLCTESLHVRYVLELLEADVPIPLLLPT